MLGQKNPRIERSHNVPSRRLFNIERDTLRQYNTIQYKDENTARKEKYTPYTYFFREEEEQEEETTIDSYNNYKKKTYIN